MNKYADIIDYKRPIIANHPPMSRDNRAAQFAPYAALVGHKEIIASEENDFLEQTDANYLIIKDEDAEDF